MTTALRTVPPSPAPAPARQDGMSLLNLAARQRMLSQRMLVQLLLAERGDTEQAGAARASLILFSDSHARLVHSATEFGAADAAVLQRAYDGPAGASMVINRFCGDMREALDEIGRAGPRSAALVAALVAGNDGVLAALNSATAAFDTVTTARNAHAAQELGAIVGDIQRVAREAKVVSFNALVMAARAGQHGREFAVVAQVLAGITERVDDLSRKAMGLVDKTA